MNRVVNKKTKKKTHHFRNFLFLVIIAFIIYYSYKYKVFEKLKNITESFSEIVAIGSSSVLQIKVGTTNSSKISFW